MKVSHGLTVAACAAVFSFVNGSAAAPNDGARLTHGPAVLDYAFTGPATLPTVSFGPSGDVQMNFQLGGLPGDPAERQVFSGNWFYRVSGDTREHFFANASNRTFTGNAVTWDFPEVFSGFSALPDIKAKMGFAVTSTGPDSAIFTTSACIYNTGIAPTPLDFDLFFAIDMDLAATTGGDDYLPVDKSSGRVWRLSDGPLWNGLIYDPGAAGTALGERQPLMIQLTNNVADNFPDIMDGGGTPINAGVVLQRHVTTGPLPCIGIPLIIGVGRNGVIPDIPEPASLPLLVLAALALVRTRRR